MPDISLLFLLSPSTAHLAPRIAASGHAWHLVTDAAHPVPVSAGTLTVLCSELMPPLDRTHLRPRLATLEPPDYAHDGIGPLDRFIDDMLG